MGKQINFYIELDAFKELAQKALDLGFKIIEQMSVPSENGLYHGECKEHLLLDEVDFSILRARYYFYLEEAGQLVFSDSGFLDTLRSPVIEVGYSKIRENIISKDRMWVSTGYWEDSETFIYRSEILGKKYDSLTRYVKRLAPYTEIQVKFRNGRMGISKEYITPYILNLLNTMQYECEAN